jgi:ribosomal-protein-alanine N-acetyltransferase
MTGGSLEVDLAGEDLAMRVARFDLRPLDDTDAGELFAHFADPSVVEFMDIDPLVEVAEAHAIIAWAKTLRERAQGLRWTIREAASGRFVGTCGFNLLIFDRGRRGEVAYDLGRDWWGQGVMAQLMPAMIAFAFDRLGVHRIEAMVTPGNERSCRLLERHGFSREGVLRGYGYWKGAFWDQIVYARIASA